MNVKSTMQSNRVLSDLFLDIMEKNSNAQQRIYINNIRACLNMPACAELFNVMLVNALGVRTPVSENTVRSAVTALISCNKADIDKTPNISDVDKERRKNLMVVWMKQCEEALIASLHNQGLLEKP